MIRSLSRELQKKAEEELNENSSRIQDDLQHMRNWLEKQPHLNIQIDDQWLLTFIRGCKFSLQKAKDKFDYFYTIRNLASEFLGDRDPLAPEIQEILKANAIFPLPTTDGPAGPRVFLYRYRACNYETMPVFNLWKVLFMGMEIHMKEDDNTAISGVQIVFDFKGFSLHYLPRITPTLVHKFMVFLQRAYPARVKGIICINYAPCLDTLLTISKPFFSKKMLARLHTFNSDNFNAFCEIVPISILPKEYGGNAGTVEELGAAWKKKLESHRDWFLENNNNRSNEELRPGKPKTSVDVFGIEGSFRQLNVD